MAPARQCIEDQRTARENFEALNRFVTERNGWITSPPGDKVIRIDALPSSTLRSDLRDAGYKVIAAGEGERILTSAIVQKFTLTSSGALEAMTESSTKPVTSTVTHAGIVTVDRFEAIAR